MPLSFRLLAMSLGFAAACPQLHKRQGVNSTVPEQNRFWAYEASYDWGRLNAGRMIFCIPPQVQRLKV